MAGKSNSYFNAWMTAGNSAYNGPFKLMHAWFCACQWCLQGIRG